ncbi:MAG: DegT/DnrJ/EryC1/StrS family aminotransferase [Candidatus Aenigmatarchaeota archaeon]
MRIPLCKPEVNEEMKKAVIETLEKDRFVLGENVKKFEEEFANYIGTKYAVAVSSGTAALQIALQSLELEKNEKVVTSSNSFISTANAILFANYLPCFADIYEDDGTIDVKTVKEEKAKVVLPVHIYGRVCNMDEIFSFFPDAVIVEDACQAHGAKYKNRKAGSLGEIGCFSFYSSKNMTVCGDGGMITTNNEKIAEIAKSLRDCGRKSKYVHDRLGGNYRLNSINASIGRVQLKYLDEWNEKRRKVAKIYRELLPENILIPEKDYSYDVYHLFVVKLKKRDYIAAYLDKNGIETGVHYPIPIHLQPIYKKLFGYKKGVLPKTERFSKMILSLPIYPSMKDEEVKFVCEKLLKVLR